MTDARWAVLVDGDPLPGSVDLTAEMAAAVFLLQTQAAPGHRVEVLQADDDVIGELG